MTSRAAIQKVISISDKKKSLLDMYSGVMGPEMVQKVLQTKWSLKDLAWLENALRKKAIDERER